MLIETLRIAARTPRALINLRQLALIFGSCTFAATVRAQERAPIHESIQALPPSVVRSIRVDGATVLVWELFVRNASTDSVEITRLVARDGRDSAHVLLDASGPALVRDLQSPTRDVTLTTAPRMAPGETRVFYAWATTAGAPVQSVQHVLDVRIAGVAAPVRLAVEAVHVRQQVVPTLGAPLRGGPWVAIYLPEVAGGHRRAIYTVDGSSTIPGRFASDWVRLTSDGRMSAATSADRNGFGDDVLAVGDGRVVIARDDMADNVDAPGQPRPRFDHAHASGNHVALQLASGAVVFYEHLRARSIRVKVGDRVRAGSVLGQLGYSGSSSIGPHLHMHVANRADVLGAEGEGFAFGGFTALGRFTSISAMLAGDAYVATETGWRTRELPAGMAVVAFGTR